nr:hypothetical protein [Tanacetum cinerariifolium]
MMDHHSGKLLRVECPPLRLGALTGEATSSMIRELTSSEVKIGDLDWTTRGWTSSVLSLLVGCIVSFVASGLFSTTLGRKEGGRWRLRLKNPPSKHLVFEEPELVKLEVGKPGVDTQEQEEN